ncbi:hypothetical protein VCHENC02_3596B, partial [Vibrio harveyi]
RRVYCVKHHYCWR